jgi:ketosteroid isomerase-like protein
MDHTDTRQTSFTDRLCEATNAHDLDRIVECFTDDYVNENPVHPARGFRGREQVRRNWTQIFAAVPDLTVRVIRSDRVGETVWSEWEMRGTRPDGGQHLMRGVMLFGLAGEQAQSMRLYLEPVDSSPTDIDEAVRLQHQSAQP